MNHRTTELASFMQRGALMTHPRFIVAGETILVTVRTITRAYLLRPDPALVEAIKYCLAYYAEKHGITLHAVCVMSTHLHLVALDTLGQRSLFLRDVNRGIANIVKAMRGWSGPVFSPKPNIVRLLTEQAIVDKIAYVLANPVAAAAVTRAAQWPGLCVAAGMPASNAGQVQRPTHFFSKTSNLPQIAHFRLELPPGLIASHGISRARRLIANAFARHENQARLKVQKLGWKVSGPRRCLRVRPSQRATTYEVFGETEPTFATLGGGKSLYAWAVTQLRTFRIQYRAALEKWRAKQRHVRFPFGTWLMRVQYGVRCETARVTAPPLALGYTL